MKWRVGVGSIVGGGIAIPYLAVRYQQKKNGYW